MNIARLLPLIYISLLALVAGCGEGEHAQRAEHAASRVSRGDGLIVPDEAQTAIGLAIASVQKHEAPQIIPATGWLTARPSGAVVIKAPTTGFIVPKKNADISFGRTVAKGERLADIEVFLSPQDQAQLVIAKEDAEKDLQQAQDTLKLNEEQLKHAEAAAPTAVAGTRLLELREIVAHARAAEDAARKKLPFLPEGAYDELKIKTVAVEAPISGRLIETHVVPRQLVVAGDSLWTIQDWSRLWVRVPVFVADLPRINQHEPANLTAPGAIGNRDAQPVSAPQVVEPGKQTIELAYEIENDSGELRPGQAVSVLLPTGRKETQTVIPRSAVLWDGMGNSWVYVRTAGNAFRRQKIETGQLFGDQVIVRRGLKQGDNVVSTGAEALYGEEFKGQIHLEEKD